MNKLATPISDDALRLLWRGNGGEFHGPHVETGTMPEAKLLPFLRAFVEHCSEQALALRGEPVAWISTCVVDGKEHYGKLPVQSLQAGFYKHTPLYR